MSYDRDEDELLHDLTPTTTDTSKMSKKQKADVNKGQQIVAKSLEGPTAVGTYETRGKEAAAGLQPLHIGNGPKTHAAHDGTPIVNYENDYNQYLFPLRATLRAMGRLTDLNGAGAPMVPEKAAKHDKLSMTQKHTKGRDDGDAVNAYNDWSAEQTELRLSVMGYNASDMKLQAAIIGYQAAQQ